jgi:HK97 family phage major capsid protein
MNARTTAAHERRSTLLAQARRLVDTAATAARDLTATEDAQYRALVAEVDSIDAGLSALADDEARASTTAAALRSIGAHKAGTRLLPSLEEYRALASSAAGVPTAYSTQWFDRLRAQVGVLAAGPVVMDVEGESLKVPTITASATVSTYGESAAITASDPTTAWVTLNPVKVAVLTKVSREAVEDSGSDLLRAVELDLVRSIGTTLDAQFIAGDGTGSNMTGLLSVGSVTAGPSLGTNGASLTFAHLADTVAAYESAGGDLSTAAWFGAPRTWASVRSLKDAQQRPIFTADPTQDVQRSIFGVPFFVSGAVPITQTAGSSSDCSTLLLVDMSRLLIGRSRDVEVRYSEDAYFGSDEIGVRVTARFDIKPSHAAAIVKTTGVRP